MTQAQEISARFHDDGQCWVDDAENDLDDFCERYALAIHDRDGDGGSVTRYHFSDGSAIVVAGDAWDLGITGEDRGSCTCWSEDGVECREPDNCGCGCHEGQS